MAVIRHKYDLVSEAAKDVNWLSRLFGRADMHLLRKCPFTMLMLGKIEQFKSILATVNLNDDFEELNADKVQDKLNRQVLAMPDLISLHVCSLTVKIYIVMALSPVFRRMLLMAILNSCIVTAKTGSVC